MATWSEVIDSLGGHLSAAVVRKISRLATGARRADPCDAWDLCPLYQVTDQAEADRLMEQRQS